jgi:hypothetical protein
MWASTTLANSQEQMTVMAFTFQQANIEASHCILTFGKEGGRSSQLSDMSLVDLNQYTHHQHILRRCAGMPFSVHMVSRNYK